MRNNFGQTLLLVLLLNISGLVHALQVGARETFRSPKSLFAMRCKSDAGVEFGLAAASDTSCVGDRETLLDFVVRGRDKQPLRQIPIWQLPDTEAFFFVSGMTVDADGAPNAYSPDDTGLDALSNAGFPGHWNGIVTDQDGRPLIQKDNDPFPGYYISCTSLADKSKKFSDPTGYVNASKIPYVVLPSEVAEAGGARLGDFAVVVNLRNGKSSFAIYADVGTLGEGSVALAENLGIHSDARHGGASGGILYLLFPGSGNRAPRTIDEIQRQGEKLLYEWGGFGKLSSCIQRDDSAGPAGDIKSAP